MAGRTRIILLLLCICLFAAPLRAAAEVKQPLLRDKECALSVSYSAEGTAFADLPVELYKVADLSADQRYTLVPAFEKTGLILDGIQNPMEWSELQSTLEAYAVACGIQADCIAATNQAGQVAFDGLKAGLYMIITEPIVRDGWTYIFEGALVALPSLGEDGAWQYQVAVSSKSEVLPPIEGDEEIELKVLKLWKGDQAAKRPKSVEAEIFRNGVLMQTVVLSEENNWSYHWVAKNDGAVWKVAERNVPAGYVMTVDEREVAFVITNTLKSSTPVPPPPHTGDTSNVMLYILLMSGSGIMLMILGIVGKRKRV